jgi:hypothetical protein
MQRSLREKSVGLTVESVAITGTPRVSAEDALMKSLGLPTAREQQVAKETDRFLRDLGL